MALGTRAVGPTTDGEQGPDRDPNHYACVLRRLPTGEAPCISVARLLRKFVNVACELSVPPIAETRLLKLDCRLAIAESVVVDAVPLDEESLASEAAS